MQARIHGGQASRDLPGFTRNRPLASITKHPIKALWRTLLLRYCKKESLPLSIGSGFGKGIACRIQEALFVSYGGATRKVG